MGAARRPRDAARRPQALFAEEDLEQARRQLVLYGRDGLPVHLPRRRAARLANPRRCAASPGHHAELVEHEIASGAAAAEFAVPDPAAAIHIPTTPLHGYEVLELQFPPDSPARGRRVADIDWPTGSIAVAVTQGREIHAARPDTRLHPGERLIVLAPTRAHEQRERPTRRLHAPSGTAHTPRNAADEALGGARPKPRS